MRISITGALEQDLFKRQWWWCWVLIGYGGSDAIDFPFLPLSLHFRLALFSSSSPVSLRSCSSTSCLIESWRLSCNPPPSPHTPLSLDRRVEGSILQSIKKYWHGCQLLCDCLCDYRGLLGSLVFFLFVGYRIGTHFLKWENMGPLHALPSGDQQPNSKFWFSCPSSPF